MGGSTPSTRPSRRSCPTRPSSRRSCACFSRSRGDVCPERRARPEQLCAGVELPDGGRSAASSPRGPMLVSTLYNLDITRDAGVAMPTHPPGVDPLQSRRQFLLKTGMGLGATALAAHSSRRTRLLAGSPTKAHTTRRQPSGDLPLHGRRPEPGRPLRLQAGPPGALQGAAAGEHQQGPARDRDDARHHEQLVAPSMFEFERKGENGIVVERALPPPRRGCRRPLRHQVAEHQRDQPRPRQDLSSAPARRSPARRAWARG